MRSVRLAIFPQDESEPSSETNAADFGLSYGGIQNKVDIFLCRTILCLIKNRKVFIMQKSPTCTIIAGPNGAGKTTFAMKYLPKIAGCLNFINADEIARGLSPLDVEAAQLQASRIFLSAIEDRISKKESFAFETTLFGKAYLQKIRQWKRSGWRVELFYLWIPSAVFSAKRVEYRVRQGGHNIPADAIMRRYPRSIANLFEYAKECDKVSCYDNSEQFSDLIFSQIGSIISVMNKNKFQQIQELAGI